jgi:hypothetical protein
MNQRILSSIMLAVLIFGGTRCLRAQAPFYGHSPPMGLADIKMLAKAGISDDIILSQIRNSHTVYHLSTAEIIDLKDNGVSQRVIDFIINTPGASPPPPAPQPVIEPTPVVVSTPPPTPIIEEVAPCPGPEYTWVAGYWRWHGGGWVWTRGRWAVPPHPRAVWQPDRWERRGGTSFWISGYWR